jgi:hypothetical protein
MDRDEVVTIEEMERLPLAERHRLAAEAIVDDVSQVPEEFLARARERGRELLEARGLTLPPK